MISEGSFWKLKNEVQKELLKDLDKDKCSQWKRCQELLLSKNIDPSYGKIKALFNLLYENKIKPFHSKYVEDLVNKKITYSEFVRKTEDDFPEDEWEEEDEEDCDTF